MKRAITLGLLAIALCVSLAAPAIAQGNKTEFPLTCNGTTYQVTISGNGNWTPARDNNSTLVFHPTAFGEFTGTFTPADGTPQTVTEPPQEFQAQPPNGHPQISCTFSFTFTDESGTFEGSGSVSGYTTGTRNN